MRWRLLLITSAVAALLGCGLWSAATIVFFGSARELARHDWLLPASIALPILFQVIAAVFVYRHTARRRKTHAVITVLLSLLLTPLAYLAVRSLLPDRLHIPRTYELRHAR